MNAPSQMSLDEVITALRSVKTEKRDTPSVAQLRRIIDDVVACVPLTQIVDRPALSQFVTADILSFAEEFGKHRARVRKRNAPKGVVVAASDTGMLPGMEPGTREVQKVIEAYRSGRKMKKSQKDMISQLPQDILDAEGPAVVLPKGFERTAGHGRDISKSVAALAVDAVEDAEIIRFAERHFSEPTTLLDADHVHLLHWVASNGLAEKLLEIGGLHVVYRDGERELESRGGSNTALVRLLVEAYDLLEVARVDALSSLATLVRGQVSDIADLRDAARKVRWLCPGEVTRLEKLMGEVERNPDNERLPQILRQRMGAFAQWVRANPGTFAVTGVDKLNSAHLAMILDGSGLLADESEEKAVIAELRARLTEMGLVNDLDREIPEGLRAFKLGKLEEFFASRQARVEGDPDWKLLFEATVASEELASV